MTTFAERVVAFLPPWLLGPNGIAFFSTLGLSRDDMAALALDATTVSWPATCGDDAIREVLRERALDDVPLATTSPRERRDIAMAAWRIWSQAGTPAGLLSVLAASGYPNARIVERVGPWHHFEVVLEPPFPFDLDAAIRSVWDDPGGVWDDGGLWGEDPLLREKARVRTLIARFAPANTTAARVTYRLTPTLSQVF